MQFSPLPNLRKPISPMPSPQQCEVSDSLGKLGTLETRLASTSAEVRQSQHLRYQVFFEELSAKPTPRVKSNRCDEDEFDARCEHLLVLDNNLTGDLTGAHSQSQIIASSRLLPQQSNPDPAEFYSNSEFDLTPLLMRNADKKFLEFGRSCVKSGYRNKRTIEMLWQGSWAYVCQNGFDVMFGCASFEGTEPEEISDSLSFLYHNARAKGQWRVNANEKIAVDMNRIPAKNIDPKKALRRLPPLIKGYLRLGALIGEDAVIDHQFGTIDVMIILPVDQLSQRYVNHYGKNADRYRRGQSS